MPPLPDGHDTKQRATAAQRQGGRFAAHDWGVFAGALSAPLAVGLFTSATGSALMRSAWVALVVGALTLLWWTSTRRLRRALAPSEPQEPEEQSESPDLPHLIHLSQASMTVAASEPNADQAIRANRSLKVLLAVRGTRVETDDERQLLMAICRAIVEATDYGVAWIAKRNDDGDSSVEPLAGWGADPSLLNTSGLSWAHGDFSFGPTGTALREGRIVTAPELAIPSPDAPWYPLVHGLQLKSEISIPLRENGVIFGALSIFAREIGAFTDTEAVLLAQTALDITAKLDATRARVARRLAQEALAASEQLLRQAEEIGRAGSWSVDFLTGKLVGSEGFYKILETAPDAFSNTPDALLAMIHEDDQALAMREYEESVRGGTDTNSAFRIVTARGNTRHIQTRGQIAVDVNGVPLRAIGMMRDVSSEVAVRKALADREALYGTMVSQARDAIAMVDPRTHKYVEFNEAAHANLGYTREEFAQFEISDIDVTFTKAAAAGALTHLMQPEGGALMTRLRCRDGSLRDVHVSARPTTIDGQIFLATVWTDVTAAMQSEVQLRRINRELQMLAAANRAILYAQDELGLLQSVCAAMVDDGGYVLAWAGRAEATGEREVTPLAMSGKTAEYVQKMRLTWSDTERGCGPTGRAIRSGTPVTAQHILSDPQFGPWREAAIENGYGSCITLPMLVEGDHATMCLTAYSANPEAFDASETTLLERLAGNVAFGLTAVRDAHARRLAETENRKLLLAVEQSPESIAITDLQARVEYVNPAFLAHTGYTREEILGANPRALKSGKTPPERYREMWARLTAGESWQGEFINKRKDGSEYIELASLSPIRQADGQVTHYLAIKDDITERKRMADELDTYRRHLEELVASRTAQLAEAQHHAEAANLAKSAFLANMSHEIRTPMNAIIGFTHLLAQADPRPEQADRLRKIDQSAKHLLAIVNDILDLSKVEAGKLQVEHADFILQDVLRSVHDALEDRARERGLTFNVALADGLPQRVSGDSLRLSQILLNLGTNAVKFTTQGEVTLRVSPGSGDGVRECLRFEVHDTGIGLSPEQVIRLFEPFEQADVSTTRKHGGTGLGLAICRRLVELMGGTIGVESQLGQGSTFWFELPFGRVGPVTPSEAARAWSGASRAVRAGVTPQNVRVLLVEDDPINQEVATALLRAKGFVVEVADNGADAIQRATATHYDCILMDVQMPVMDGLTATRTLRTHRVTANTPILAMTASAFVEDRTACHDAGMDDFVAKPIQPDALFATLARWTGAVLPAPVPQPHPALAKSVTATQRLAAVTGLNSAAGLRVVQGDVEAYERLLRRFCDERAGSVAALRDDVAAKRWEDARRATHTLRGLAATLGAESLRFAAAEVESVLALSPPEAQRIAERIEALDGELQSLIGQLRTCLTVVPQPVPRDVDWQAAREALEELRTLLVDDDVRALEVLRQKTDVLRVALGPKAMELRRAVEGFDFEDAQRLVQDCIASEPALRPGD